VIILLLTLCAYPVLLFFTGPVSKSNRSKKCNHSFNKIKYNMSFFLFLLFINKQDCYNTLFTEPINLSYKKSSSDIFQCVFFQTATLHPGFNTFNKKSTIWEIFRKSQKILNLPFLLERSKKLFCWCLARLAY
jgi:hypothetical protein